MEKIIKRLGDYKNYFRYVLSMKSTSIMSSSSSSLIVQVLRMAKQTFARTPSILNQKRKFVLPPDEFKSKLQDLRQLVDRLQSSDLGLEHSKVLTSSSREKLPHEAPVTYIKLLDDTDVSIGIFIVKSGFRIPLHNHPNMHGLLKVVYGNVDVNVYTKWIPKNSDPLEIPSFLQDKTHLIHQGLVFPTEKHILKNVDSTFEPLLLYPGMSIPIVLF